MYEYKAFYQMVERWTVNDFCTPGLKAEVIIDMLLSEFIEEIVCYGLHEKEGEGDWERDNFQLVAKEFPIVTNKNDLRNIKIDYLIAFNSHRTNGKKLYLVELKTTSESFSEEQFQLYDLYRKRGSKKLMKDFCRIIKKYLNLNDLFSFRSPVKMKSSKKYATIVRNFMEQEKGRYRSFTKIEDIADDLNLPGKYKEYELEIIYISLVKLNNKKVEEMRKDQKASHIHFIELNNQGFRERLKKALEKEKAEKRECWGLVEKILDQLTDISFQGWKKVW